MCAVIAILTSALTLASFIKFFGVSFLSRTSALVTAQAARHGRLEVGWTMQLPQVALALACVLLGVVPAIGFRLMQLALDASRQGYGAALANAAPDATRACGRASSSRGRRPCLRRWCSLLVLGVMFLLVRVLSKLGGASRRAAAPWLCGYVARGGLPPLLGP